MTDLKKTILVKRTSVVTTTWKISAEDILRAFGLPGAAKLHAEDLDYEGTVEKLTVTFEQSFNETFHGLDEETN